MTETTVIYDPAAGVGSLADVRPGDHADIKVRIGGGWRRMRDCDVWQAKSGTLRVGETILRYSGGEPAGGVRVLRVWREVPPMLPLPTTPGDVIRATVRGVPGVRLFYAPEQYGGRTPWHSAVPVRGFYWHSSVHITAWEPIAVQEVTR